MSASTRTSPLNDARLLDNVDSTSEFASASGLVQRLRRSHPSTAEILQELRRRFPHSPLSMRVAALDPLRSD